MTKQEKIGLLYIPVLFLLLAVNWRSSGGGWLYSGPRLYFAFGFSVLIYVLCFWANRGTTARWVEFIGDDAIRSRKPMALRILAGLFAPVFVVPIVWLCQDIPWPLTLEEFLGLFFALLVFGGLVAFFLFLAGPQEMRFDLRKREWQRTWGFPLLSWTSHGLTYEGTLVVRFSPARGGGYYRLHFKPPIGWPIILGMYGERDTARAEAHRVSHLLRIALDDQIKRWDP